MRIGKPRILNVDDNEGSRYAVTRVLEHAGFEVGEAASGKEALRVARAERPDLVLLDVNLPDITGFDVCRSLKLAPETTNIPVMHITASYAKSVDMVQGLNSGAEAYLIEPVEPEVLIATIRAVLRARHAEEIARTLAREWETTFDAMRDGVALVNLEGKIQRLNGSMTTLLGRSKAELAGMDSTKLWGALAADREPFARALISSRRESVELDFDGRRLTITVDPVFDEDGRVSGAVQIISDITEQHKMAQQFYEAQKVETVGTLAAGVAHDFNNLLTSIMGNASLLLGDLGEGNPLQERLNDVVRASQRAADLTKQLLAYSGKGRHFLQKLELSSVVRSMTALIEATITKKIRVEWRLAPNLPEIEADSNQVQQLVMNLITNAAEAIGENAGVIAISTGLESGDRPYVEVTDNGCGMNAETKSRIFDPFFTTKFTGRGLGMAAVAGIVRGHKASIEVKSGVGEGSTFRVTFPPATAAKIAPPKPGPASNSKVTILVVDDEDMVRRIAQASLEIRGYRVLLATNGLEAIQMVEKHAEIAIVLLDLTMPVMSGEEAIDRLLAARPALQVIVSTGYGQREVAARFSRKSVQGFLHKPYTSKQLADKVASLLEVNNRDSQAKA
ncbi:MAG TPA: response regulator [Bryobacteraceae bacterium]|jgi:PAS domain S-box-containing protein|nr:response regulator [Bryobacteraceae bacterium]